jgi:hypothetical protein
MLEHGHLIRCRSHLANKRVHDILNTLLCLLTIGVENLTLTRQGWKLEYYTITYFEEVRVAVYIRLYITYGEIGDTIPKAQNVTIWTLP